MMNDEESLNTELYKLEKEIESITYRQIKPTHSIKIRGQELDIKWNRKKIFDFADWRKACPVILSTLLYLANKIYGFDPLQTYIKILKANPVRTSRYGKFYVKVKVLVKYQGIDRPDIRLKVIPVESYKTIDIEEIEKKEQITKTIGKNEYLIEQEIRKKSMLPLKDSIIKEYLRNNIDTETNTEILFLKAIEYLMKEEGWHPEEDNRLMNRVKRTALELQQFTNFNKKDIPHT